MNVPPVISWMLVLLGFLIAITLTYHELRMEKKKALNEVSLLASVKPLVLAKPKKYLRFDHSIAVDQIARRMETLHGHADLEGLTADVKDGVLVSDLLSRNCTRCGKPRNQEGDTLHGL